MRKYTSVPKTEGGAPTSRTTTSSATYSHEAFRHLGPFGSRRPSVAVKRRLSHPGGSLRATRSQRRFRARSSERLHRRRGRRGGAAPQSVSWNPRSVGAEALCGGDVLEVQQLSLAELQYVPRAFQTSG